MCTLRLSYHMSECGYILLSVIECGCLTWFSPPQLWEGMMPGTQLKERISKQWQDLGFQGNNPATDFRGMGILGLKCMLYPLIRSHGSHMTWICKFEGQVF